VHVYAINPHPLLQTASHLQRSRNIGTTQSHGGIVTQKKAAGTKGFGDCTAFGSSSCIFRFHSLAAEAWYSLQLAMIAQ
jgi:hypothetical protein